MRLPLFCVAALLISLVLAPAVGARASAPAGAVGVVRGPILIEGDAALTSANGVTGGSGTPTDPFVISGWEINASTATGVDVRNTTASLVLRSLKVVGSGSPWLYPGIHLNHVSHVAVENVTVRDTLAGVRVESSANVAVTDSDLSASRLGVSVVTVVNATLARNTVRAGGPSMLVGLDLSQFNESTIIGNTVALDVAGAGMHEIHLASSSGVTITDNTIGNASWIPSAGVGLWLDGDVDVVVQGNAFVARGLSPTPFGGSAYHPFSLTLASFATLSIRPDNTINGRPILFCVGTPAWTYDGVFAGEIILADCDGALVSNVTFPSGQLGVVVALSRSVTIVGDEFDGVTLGVSTWASDVHVYHNNFNRSGVAQVPSGSGASTVAYDDGYPRGGNYWSGSPGVDACSGPAQDVCPDPDGFRDTPQELGAGFYDDYPLMAPADLANRWPSVVLDTDTVVADLLTPIRFSAAGSWDLTGNASDIRMRWDFDGDGHFDTGWEPLGSFPRYFAAPGFYHVTLEIRDGGGLLATTFRVVLVEYFHGWDILVPILGAVVATLAANYALHRVLVRHRRARVRKDWTGPSPPETKGGAPASEPPTEAHPPIEPPSEERPLR